MSLGCFTVVLLSVRSFLGTLTENLFAALAPRQGRPIGGFSGYSGLGSSDMARVRPLFLACVLLSPGAVASAQIIGTITISGAQKGIATDTITVNGSEQSMAINLQATNPPSGCDVVIVIPPYTAECYDAGGGQVVINEIQVSNGQQVSNWGQSYVYGPGSTATSIAASLVSAINSSSGMPYTATQSGSQVNLTATEPYPPNYVYPVSGGGGCAGAFSPCSFSLSVGSTAIGYDSGTISATINGTTLSTPYYPGLDPSTIAGALAGVINQTFSGTLSATSSGSSIQLTAANSSSWNITGSVTSNASANFPVPSYSIAYQSAVVPTITRTSLLFSRVSVNSGTPVVVTAIVVPVVAGGQPSGVVSFYDNGTSLGSATVSGGQASFSTSSLAAGAHSITAQYSGDGITSRPLSALGLDLSWSTRTLLPYCQPITILVRWPATVPRATTAMAYQRPAPNCLTRKEWQ
jgi:hypothetical protein